MSNCSFFSGQARPGSEGKLSTQSEFRYSCPTRSVYFLCKQVIYMNYWCRPSVSRKYTHLCTCQLIFNFYVTGNGSMPPFANNAPPSAPRDSSFGGMGRPNGRAPGNGAPQVTVAGPPAASKSSVTISNGRDPRRAKR